MKIINLLIFTSLLAVTNFASASALIDVREIGILIEQLDEDAFKCEVTEDLLDASVRVPLSNSRIKIGTQTSLSDGYIYVVATVLNDGNFCILNLSVSFQKYVPSERDTGEFWSKGQIMSIRKINVTKNLAATVELMTKQFISAWLKANQN
jgi:hypothetical protein